MSWFPQVSILLPNFNSHPFLEERITSIQAQSFTDWEVVVVDSYSSDGSWEFLQKAAQTDKRVRNYQFPKEGIYPALNACVELSRGDYIYIATSDDTMFPECLATMMQGFKDYPEAGICSSNLLIIDEVGEPLTHLWRQLPASVFYENIIDILHLRLAPYNGLLHCGFGQVHTSLTELLIRREVFDKVGLFSSRWGSKGDFEWVMRANLAYNTLHLPKTLATWRIHQYQATNHQAHLHCSHYLDLIEMVQYALPILAEYHPQVYQRLNLNRILFCYTRTFFHFFRKNKDSFSEKLQYLIRFFKIIPPSMMIEFFRIYALIKNVNDLTYIRNELELLGLKDYLQIKSDRESDREEV